MNAIKIDIAEWEYFGEGGSSTSYTKKFGGNLILKLNNRNIPAETTEKEYLASKAFNESGFPSPEIYDFVTDGERFGYTSQRIKGKLSYARLLSQEPDSVDRLAQKFAALTRDIHKTPADATKMTDFREHLSGVMGDLSFVPEDVASAVRAGISSLGDDCVCLHGDLNPGNLISFERKDCWIGVNGFYYGDPYLDIATMFILCFLLPAKRVKELYHVRQSAMISFFTAFKKHYFGKDWNSAEVDSRIRNAAVVRFCAMSAENPEYAEILIPFVRNRRLLLFIRRMFGK